MAVTPEQRAKALDLQSKVRNDFMRRLFAVAISVGFATSLANQEWVREGHLPLFSDYKHLIILATGLYATVLSWDGYLASIEKRPLIRFWRFAIDILLVFTYMFFLITARHERLWLPLLAVIFVLYVVWDSLSVRQYINQYAADLFLADKPHDARVRDILRVYARGAVSKPGTSRGPITTLCWAIFFLMLATLNYKYSGPYQVAVMCTIACSAMYLYRKDKTMESEFDDFFGYSMRVRVAYIGGLIAIALMYFRLFGNL